MAITFISQPTQWDPICNPTIFVFESDNTGQANFSFVIEVYFNAGLISTHQVFPEDGDSGKFDLSSIGRAIITNNFPDPLLLDQELMGSPQTFLLLVYERYGTPAEVQVASAEASNGIEFLNAAFRQEFWLSWNYQDYDIEQASGTRLFLTEFPRDKRDLVGYYDYKYLSIINSTGTLVYGQAVLYDINNSVIASADFIKDNYTIPLVQVGPESLVIGTTLVVGNFTNCYYYTIEIYQNAAPTKDSELYKIYYDQSCSNYPRYRLHWLNKFGAWDSFTFNLLSEHSTDIEATRYNRRTGRWQAGDYEYSLSDGNRMTVNKSMSDKLLLNSDWIHEDIQQWLVRDLYESPRVYIQKDFGSSVLEPVNVTNANYTLKQRRKAGLIQEAVQIDRTYTYQTQLG